MSADDVIEVLGIIALVLIILALACIGIAFIVYFIGGMFALLGGSILLTLEALNVEVVITFWKAAAVGVVTAIVISLFAQAIKWSTEPG